ncbi:DUF3255 family protein [Pseudomonas sp. ISL-88]|uniref:DUF3255 family protein n=2 Tax=Bacteria TaxID=2 RepID=UPI001BE53A3E|nr:DUF3255 family protein [Pseudomonas sp. ISL-88]MBT2713737.1 DUF3255 family protein [Pseudomonas sp. ISL-88]
MRNTHSRGIGFITLLLIIACVMMTGCQQKKEDETPFYYGTWDEGLKPGPMDGVRSETVTFTKDKVLTKQVMKGRGEAELPFKAYKVLSQSTDGTITIQYLGSPHPGESTLKRGKNGTLIWIENGEIKTMKRMKTGEEDKHEK